MSASNVLGVSWRDVHDTWQRHYEGDAKKAFDLFYSYDQFFSETANTYGIPLMLGKAVNDGHWEVFMGTHICEQLLEFIKESIPNYPAPSLTELNLRQYKVMESFEANNANVFRKQNQKASKKNKAHTKLVEAKQMAQYTHQLVHGKQYVFISVDIEAYERDHSILLEIGWSLFDAANNRFMDQHYAMDTHKHLQNGQFVSDERSQFRFGTTVWCSLKQALKELRKDLDWAVNRDGGFILVGHGLDSDIKYLKQQKFMWPTSEGTETMEVNESALITILNTETLYAVSINDLHNPPSLGKTLDILGVETWSLHNAGNDAHYTLHLLMKLCGYC